MLACMHACLLSGANVIDGANFISACLLVFLLAGANVIDGVNAIDGALGQVIKVTLLENPCLHACMHACLLAVDDFHISDGGWDLLSC